MCSGRGREFEVKRRKKGVNRTRRALCLLSNTRNVSYLPDIQSSGAKDPTQSGHRGLGEMRGSYNTQDLCKNTRGAFFFCASRYPVDNGLFAKHRRLFAPSNPPCRFAGSSAGVSRDRGMGLMRRLPGVHKRFGCGVLDS